MLTPYSFLAMQIYTQDELKINIDEFSTQVKKGALFIHPTDTIYGLGCSALNNKAVKKLRQIKHQESQPFSVIAPNKGWIFTHCVVPIFAEKWIDRLPGPYTLILKIKNLDTVAPEVLCGMKTIGVRIPHHWMSRAVSEIGEPIVTTSANIHGKDYMTNLESLDPSFKKHLSYIIFEGEKTGKPSTIVHLDDFEREEKVVQR